MGTWTKSKREKRTSGDMGHALVELYCSIAWIEVEVILNDNGAFD